MMIHFDDFRPSSRATDGAEELARRAAAVIERVELDLLDAYDATCGRGLATGISED